MRMQRAERIVLTLLIVIALAMGLFVVLTF